MFHMKHCKSLYEDNYNNLLYLSGLVYEIEEVSNHKNVCLG